MITTYWQSFGEVEAYFEIVDARLVVLKNIYPLRYGWRWVVIPRVNGHLDIDHAEQSSSINSEREPYPNKEAAMDACENYYAREWHGVS